ncbi:MAG: VCBS repeat-containing protein, partial [Syntrophorhabdaceae bacterium]|nr:VCBS repeat-containing protein [Syntrophorhabdaceae bacterium]
MRLAGSRSCRRFTWLLILAFSLFSTPHSGLCLLCLADLLVSAAYAGEQAETRPPQGDDAQQAPPQMMMAGSGGTAGSMTGALSPSINVSPFAGTATAAIPIEVPPGRKGMAPKLALNYSSQQGSGWIGMGWTIDLGAIQRSTKRGTSYTTNNYVAAINGSSAELVPRADWGTNHYGARIEGTLSRYYYNTATGGWEVASKDGTRYYYGSTQASRQDATSWQVGTKVFAWRLDKVIDTNGNYMTVSYTKDQGEIYPYRIDYTCNAAAGLSATNSVKFYLEPRTDVPVMFTTSYQVKTAKRLKTIEVKSGGARVRAYRLTYVTSASTSRSLLASVQMFGSDATVNASGTITGGSGLPPVTLRYDETKTHSFTAGPDGVYIPNTYGYTYPFFTFGDFNGDNKTDVIYHRMNGTWMVVFSNGDGTFTPGPEILIPNVDTYGSPHFSFGDFNADGKTDIIHLTTGGLWRVLLSNGNGTFIPGPDVAIPDVDSYCSPHFSFVDINGDGKTDIIHLIKNTNAWRVLFSNGNGTFTPGPDVAIPNVNTYGSPHFSFGDFNADGKADIIHLTTGGLWRVLLSQGNGTFIPGPDVAIPGPYSYSSPFWSYADFNGDGKTDIIYHTTGGTWKVMFSNGDGAFTASSGVSIPGPYSYSYPFWHYGDFNGDGKADIISLTTGNAWVVYFSNGNGTFTAGSGTIIPNAYQHAYPFWSYADFNGDGRTDIFYHTLSSAWAMRLSDSGGDLLVSITNGLGGTTSLSYTPSSAYQNTYLPFIVWTVSQITQDDGRGQSYATRYAYTGGWFDPIEREFMGFRYAPSYQMRDASTYESVTETWYHQDITRKGMIEAERTTSFEGHTRQVNNTWTIRNVQNSSGNPISTVTYPSLDTTVSSITDSGYTPYTYAIDYVYDPIYLNV